MKKLLTFAVLFLAFAAMADQNWVRVMCEPNWNLGDTSPGPGSAGMYSVYYAPTNGWGNTAEEILPKLKLFSPKEFEENFTKLETPAATYSRNDQQYTFTEYGATIDPTKSYFAVILCKDETKYGYYYRVIDSHLSNYDHFLSGEPNEKCSAHLSFGYFYHIDIAYAYKAVQNETDEEGEETYVSYMTDWDQGKLESAGEFLAGESRTYSTVELATAAAAKINANPRKQISIPEELKNADDATLNSYSDMFVMTLSGQTVSVNLTPAAQANIQSTVDVAATNVLYGVTNGLSTVTLSTVPGIGYTISYGADTNSVVTMTNLVATANTMEVVVSTDLNPLVENIWVVAAPIGEKVSFAGTASIELVKFQAPSDQRRFATANLAARAAALVNGDIQKYVEPIANPNVALADVTDEYLSHYEATATGNGVSIGLTAAAKTAIQNSVVDAQPVVYNEILNRSSVEITNAVPGVYYAIEYGTDANLGKKTAAVLATNSLVTLEYPNVNLAKFAIRVKATAPISAGGVQLWEDGPYWAECNVGANTEDEAGYYFRWGDTVGYTYEGGKRLSLGYTGVTWVSSEGTRMTVSPFSSTACPTYNKNLSTLQELGYCDSIGNLTPEHDAATAHLGAPWRMPTAEEFSALISNCDSTWTTSNGMAGRRVVSRGDSSRSTFLPAVGYGLTINFTYPSARGCYWSSTPKSSSNTQGNRLYMTSTAFNSSAESFYYGFPVRAVKYPETFVSDVKSFDPSTTGGECESEEQAQTVAAAINDDLRNSIAIPDALMTSTNVTEAATEEEKELILSSYTSLFTATASGTTVIVDLTPAATNVIRETVNDAQEEVLSAVLGGDDKVAIDAVPGIYYAIEYGTGLDLGSNTPGTMATGKKVELQKPSVSGNAAFFRVKASLKPIEGKSN